MARRRSVFIFLSCCFLVNCEINPENASNKVQTHSAEIEAVLNYLNSTPVKVYNYKEGTLLNAHTKADITELTLDVSVDCLSNYPELPCNDRTLICKAYVRNNAGGTQVLNDVKCKPKPEIIIEEPPYLPSVNTTQSETKSVALSNEAVSSEVGEHFVAVRRDQVPCLGCPFDLHTNAEGVDELIDLALGHIESERENKQALVKVLKLQQQVVSGVKYILTAEIAPTVCAKSSSLNLESCPLNADAHSTICQITYLHKPWINRAKHITSNNCTVSQEYVKTDPKKDQDNEIDINGGRPKSGFVPNPNFDQIAQNGAADEMTPVRLADLESQIIVDVAPQQEMREPRFDFSDDFIIPSTAQSDVSVIENQPLEDRPTIHNTEETNPGPSQSGIYYTESTPLTIDQQQQMAVDDFVAAYYGSVDSADFPDKLTDEVTPASTPGQIGNNRKKRAIRQFEKISPEEKGLVANLADYAATALDNIDDDNNRRVVLQILGAKKMVADDGVYYRLIMRMGISHCLEDKSPNRNENCREKLFENYTKICKVQVLVNDDFVTPEVVKSQCQNIKRDQNDSNRTNYSRFKREVLLGGLRKIDKDGDKVRQLLHEGITHLNLQSKEDNKYKPLEVISATSQLVSGVITRIKVKLSLADCLNSESKDFEECEFLPEAPSKICDLKIWEKSWLRFKQVTITCENDDKVYKYETGGEQQRAKRAIPGGQFDVSPDDEFVGKYLESSLKHLDAESSHENKLKVHEIISVTKQVVAGHIYRIKAKVIQSDCKKNDAKERGLCGTLAGAEPKICNFQIYERLWVPNSRQTNVTCENEPQEHFFRAKRGIVGGDVELPKDDEFVVRYLEDGLENLDLETSHEHKLKIHEVVKATQQIVNGKIYKIKTKIVLSNCKKNNSTSRRQCGSLEGEEPKRCDFLIHQQLWRPDDRETTITCDGNPKEYFFRSKHGVNNELSEHFAMFNDFIKKHRKNYTKKEYKYRFKVFSDNMRRIKDLNTFEQGTAKYGVTRFADMTGNEFSKSLGLRPDLHNENEPPFAEAEIPNIEIPTEFDWRTKGVVTGVKNQEQCGSCWAFSVTGNVEGQYAIVHEKLLEFSEQELVDCDSEDQGCNGGLMDNAYRAIEKLGGLETEQDYPYDAEDEKCHFNRTLARVQLTGALNISHNETDMAKWLVQNGPISIAINANAMQFYMGGVSHPFKFLCNPNSLDHGVLIVGYGVHNYPLFKKSLPYWIVKNSWGTSWGEQGYYRVYRGDGTCGLNQTPSSAIVA